MKRRVDWLILMTGILLLIHASAFADSWTCLSCGQKGNTGNYCPNCAAPRPVTTWTCAVCGQSGNTGNFCPNCSASRNAVPASTGVTATLKSQLSTRTGPSTAYDEPGTFFSSTWQNETVMVYSKAFGSGVWWLQIEFQTREGLMRAYTGLKRVNVDIDMIPEETCLGYGMMNLAGDVQGYSGPGTQYAVIRREIPWSVDVSIWGSENTYYLVEFYDEGLSCLRRAWVPRSWVDVY